jgi:hypothetical protein
MDREIDHLTTGLKSAALLSLQHLVACSLHGQSQPSLNDLVQDHEKNTVEVDGPWSECASSDRDLAHMLFRFVFSAWKGCG